MGTEGIRWEVGGWREAILGEETETGRQLGDDVET